MTRQEIQQKIIDLLSEISKKQHQIYKLARMRDEIDKQNLLTKEKPQ
jgi:hypothetical protein